MSRFFEKRYNVEDRELIYEEEQYQQKETTANKNRNKTRKMHENYRTSSSGSDVECRDSQKCIRPVLRAPTPPPVVRRIVERAPTPEQDVIERVSFNYLQTAFIRIDTKTECLISMSLDHC